MNASRRTSRRYDKMGRVEAADVCALPGVLCDISMGGCKVSFPAPVTVDMDGLYVLTLKIPHKAGGGPIVLDCTPRWQSDTAAGTVLGFSVRHTRDFLRLQTLVQALKQGDKSPGSDVMDMIVDVQPVFVC